MGIGETAFGLTVTGIQPDRVDVVDGSERFELRVGSEGFFRQDADDAEEPSGPYPAGGPPGAP